MAWWGAEGGPAPPQASSPLSEPSLPRQDLSLCPAHYPVGRPPPQALAYPGLPPSHPPFSSTPGPSPLTGRPQASRARRPRSRYPWTVRGLRACEELPKLVSPSLLEASFSFLGRMWGPLRQLPGLVPPGLALSPLRISPPTPPSQWGGEWAAATRGLCDQSDKGGIQTAPQATLLGPFPPRELCTKTCPPQNKTKQKKRNKTKQNFAP